MSLWLFFPLPFVRCSVAEEASLFFPLSVPTPKNQLAFLAIPTFAAPPARWVDVFTARSAVTQSPLSWLVLGRQFRTHQHTVYVKLGFYAPMCIAFALSDIELCLLSAQFGQVLSQSAWVLTTLLAA